MAKKVPLKFRSVTYPNSDNNDQEIESNRGKLKRMDSVDCERSLNSVSNLSSQTSLKYLSPSTVHSFRSSSSRYRDLSQEGRRRVDQFQHTHSASGPLGPGKKLLRFSDGGPNRSGVSFQAGLNPQMRSSSCLPLSKQRSSISPKTSNLNLDRAGESQKLSIDKPSLSPNRSQERNETVTTPKSKSGKKLERFFSTDSSASNPAEPASTASASDNRSRRSQFRRAISLFSLNCDKETDREKREKTSQKILRPPTRHVYRRGLSGLPIECTFRSIGVVY